MMTRRILVCAAAALLSGCGTTMAGSAGGFAVEVLVDGRPVPVHHFRGSRYVEAIKGREYAIRLRNPLGVRVAVALSVDGLNSIDAQRTTAVAARKWVLGPYETVTISGWQTSQAHARRFYFTSEEQSYAQRLGHGENLGVISAVFFRERVSAPVPIAGDARQPDAAQRERSADQARRQGSPSEPEGAASAPAPQTAAPESAAKRAPVLVEEDYAATGIGRQTEHRVEQVFLDLEPTPVATIDVRYEYRAQLVRLGVIPTPVDRLTRRERARGFEPGFCPAPQGR